MAHRVVLVTFIICQLFLVRAEAFNFVSIGTGGVKGVYYPAGAGICQLINSTRTEHDIRCSAESTIGSVYNLKAIDDGKMEMAIVQSDWQYHAYHGTDKFAERGPSKDLRSVLSLHPEPFTVVARVDSGIDNFTDLKGKRVNIGNPGSGQRGTMEVVMAAFGWSQEDFAEVYELESGDQAQALCEDKFDAMVFTVGHPSDSIKEATSSCQTVLIDVDGPRIDKLIADNAYYIPATIPGGMYRGTKTEVATFGVGATLVVSSRVPEDVVYRITKIIIENLPLLRQQHPALRRLLKDHMVVDGLSAPLHPGALHYYQEVGLL